LDSFFSTILGFKTDSDSILAQTQSVDSTVDSLMGHGVGSSRTQASKRKAADTPPPQEKPRKQVRNKSSGIKIIELASNPSLAPTPLESTGGGTISFDLTGRLNWNLPLCWFCFFYFNRRTGPRGISFQTPLWRVLSQVTRSQRVRITRVWVQPKVHPTCQKLRALRILHPGQWFQARVLWRIWGILNRLSPLRPLHQTTLLMELVLLAKIILVVTLLGLNLKVFLSEPPGGGNTSQRPRFYPSRILHWQVHYCRGGYRGRSLEHWGTSHRIEILLE
jgi:hypothetical protein